MDRFLEAVDLSTLSAPLDSIVDIDLQNNEVNVYEHVPRPAAGAELDVAFEVEICNLLSTHTDVSEADLLAMEAQVPGFHHVSFDSATGRHVYRYDPPNRGGDDEARPSSASLKAAA